MSVQAANTIAKTLEPGVKRFFGDMMAKQDSIYGMMFDEETSQRRYEEYVQLIGVGLLSRKTEGRAMSFDVMKQGYITRLVAETWALGFAITQEAFDDNLYGGIIRNQVPRLTRAVAATYDRLAANVYDRAFSSTYKGGDQVSLLNTAHPDGNGGTFSNKMSVDADFSEVAFEQSVIDIGNWVDARGVPMKARIKSLIHPNGIRFEVARFLQTEKTVGTNNNDMNVSRALLPAAHLSYDLTDQDAWFLRTDIPGLRFINRERPRFGNDSDFQTENLFYKVVLRCVFGWDDPHALYGSQGA